MKKLFASILTFVLVFTPLVALAAEAEISAVGDTTDVQFLNGSPTLVWISDTEGFAFYIEQNNIARMASTTDSGATWGNVQTVDPQTDVLKMTVWYDQWTPGDTSGTKIHVVTVDSGTDDTYYTEYDTVTDALSTTVITGTETGSVSAFENSPSITKAENGDLYVALSESGDQWVHFCAAASDCTNGANWSAITNPFSGSPIRWSFLMPVAGTDNIMIVEWDAGSNDIESNIWSATSTSWWGFDLGINQNADDNGTYDSQFYGGTINRTTGEIYLAYVDDANDYSTEDHDLHVFEFDNSTYAWTQKTDVLTNTSGGLQGAKIAIDENTGDLYVVYIRRSTIGTATTGDIYYKKSTDNGTTWGAESSAINTLLSDDIYGLSVNIMSDERIGVMWKYITAPEGNDVYHETVIDLSPTVSTAAVGNPRVLRLGTLILHFGTLIIY